MSGNTFGAVYWSDGKRESPMLPEYPAATTCRRCGHFFFFEDAASPEPQDDPQVKERNIADNLYWQECNTALGDGAPRSKPQEIYLRLRLWWSANDAVRHGKSATPSCPEDVFRGNLDALLPHFEGPDPSETILRAEVLRELGRFDDALRALLIGDWIFRVIGSGRGFFGGSISTVLASQNSGIVRRLACLRVAWTRSGGVLQEVFFLAHGRGPQG